MGTILFLEGQETTIFDMEIAMQINSETFKKLRKSKGFSQQTLADESGVAQKTIARIETGKGEPRGSTVQELSKALGVKPEVLAEELDSETMLYLESRYSGSRKVTVRLDAKTVFAYDLACERYGVEQRLILEGAPVFFTLLAEMGLTDRRRRVKKIQASIPTHLDRYSDAITSEEDSIAKKDLFASLITGGYVSPNPFSDFLSRLAEEVDPESNAIDCEGLRWDFDESGFRDSPCLYQTYRKSLTGDSARADYTLSRGYVRISQIPKELRGEDDDITSERVKWLEEKVPDEDWEEYEHLLEYFDNKSSSEGDTKNA